MGLCVKNEIEAGGTHTVERGLRTLSPAPGSLGLQMTCAGSVLSHSRPGEAPPGTPSLGPGRNLLEADL